MKKLLLMILAVGALNMVPSVEARCFKERCRKKECYRPCAPKCTTEEHRQIVQEPCEKWVLIKGTCPHEICTKITTCTSDSKKCVGPCVGGCENGVTAADRGELDYDIEVEGY